MLVSNWDKTTQIREIVSMDAKKKGIVVKLQHQPLLMLTLIKAISIIIKNYCFLIRVEANKCRQSAPSQLLHWRAHIPPHSSDQTRFSADWRQPSSSLCEKEESCASQFLSADLLWLL